MQGNQPLGLLLRQGSVIGSVFPAGGVRLFGRAADHFGAPFAPCFEPPFGGFFPCGFCLGDGKFLRPRLKIPIRPRPCPTPCRPDRSRVST